MKVLLKNGHLVDYASNTDKITDILIEDNIIKKIGEITESVDNTIDCSNLFVLPGLIDIHCHLRDPGFEYKEDIESGIKSAAKGGFTGIACMPNTNPPTDSIEILKYILEKSQKVNMTTVYPIATITKKMAGEEVNDFKTLKEAGAIAVSDDGKPVTNTKVMRDAVISAFQNDLPIIEHCEDMYIASGIITDCEYSRKLNIPGVPKEAEEIDVARQIVLAKNNKTRIHIAHISTKGSVDLIRQAKKEGVLITCETCPHYFSLLVEDTNGDKPNAKMNPPLREQVDMDAIIEGLKDGTIDAIATDHAPHSEEEKEKGIMVCPNGIIGFETSLKLGITYLVKPGHITLLKLVELMSYNPSNILNLNKGKICENGCADLTIIDANLESIYTKESIVSKSKNSPYIGYSLTGEVMYTIVNGKIVYKK